MRHLFAVMLLLCSSNVVRSAAFLLRRPSGRKAHIIQQCSSRSHTHEPSVLDIVQRTIQEEILKDNSTDADPVTMVLAVSGGCDSVALLHMLQAIRQQHWELRVVHFDHQQRGPASDGDRLFTEQLCAQYGLPFDCFYWDEQNRQQSSPQERFSQDAARQWRRSRMMDLRNKQPRRALLLTAHHKDDSEETLLLKLLRGVHITNLSGLLPVTEDGIWARPMIHVRKHDIVRYLKEHGWDWREDDSNKSSKYLRNRVRNELVPLLQDMIGSQGLERRLQSVQEQADDVRCDISNRVNLSLEGQGTEMFLLPSDRSDLYLVIQAFHAWAARRGCIIDYDQTKRIRTQLGRHDQRQWTLNVGKHWNVECFGDSLRLRKANEEDSAPAVREPSTTHEVEWSFCERDIETAMDGLIIYVADADENLHFTFSIVGEAKLTVTPPWRQNPIRVAELLRGQKVPLHRRRAAPIIQVHYPTGEKNLVAIYAETEQRWICDSFFAKPDETTRPILLQVEKAIMSQVQSEDETRKG